MSLVIGDNMQCKGVEGFECWSDMVVEMLINGKKRSYNAYSSSA
jgi:hypothetical protein